MMAGWSFQSTQGPLALKASITLAKTITFTSVKTQDEQHPTQNITGKDNVMLQISS